MFLYIHVENQKL